MVKWTSDNGRKRGDDPPNSKKHARSEDPSTRPMDAGSGGTGGHVRLLKLYLPYYKPNYKRLYPENLTKY